MMRLLLVISLTLRVVEASNVTIHKIDSPKKGDCGESSCPAGVAHFPETFGGYKEGTCASVGYTVPDGEQDFKEPLSSCSRNPLGRSWPAT